MRTNRKAGLAVPAALVVCVLLFGYVSSAFAHTEFEPLVVGSAGNLAADPPAPFFRAIFKAVGLALAGKSQNKVANEIGAAFITAAVVFVTVFIFGRAETYSKVKRVTPEEAAQIAHAEFDH